MAVAIELAIALATLLVEDEHLVALYEGSEHFAYYLCSRNSGSTDSDSSSIVYEEHLVEFNSLTGFGTLKVIDKELLALLHLKLLTVDLYDCVHEML